MTSGTQPIAQRESIGQREPTGEREPERPLRRDAERNRQKIVAAAREVFARRGLTATLDDVAHAAGVGVGTVYRRFPDKEALVEAALEDRLEEVVTVLEGAVAEKCAWEGLTLFLQRTAEMHAEDRGLREVALRAGHGKDHLPAVRERIEPLVHQLVDRAHREGALRPDAGADDIPLLLHMVGAVADSAHTVRPDLHRRYLGLLIEGLRNRPDRAELVPGLTSDELAAVSRSWKPSA